MVRVQVPVCWRYLAFLSDLSLFHHRQDLQEFTSLKGLQLGGFANLTSPGLAQIAHQCPQVEQLSVNEDEDNISDDNLNFFIKRLKGSLRHLHINKGVVLTDKSLSNLGLLTKLEYLYIGFHAEVGPRGLRAIASLSNLKRLTIMGWKEYLQGEDLVGAFSNRKLEKLKWLGLQFCGELLDADAGLMALAKSCPNLERLLLDTSGEFTDTSLMFFVNSCKFLTSIDLGAVNR